MMRSLILAALAALISGPVEAEPGRLVIVGGALTRDNAAVWRAFIDGMRHPDTDRIAVVAAASGEPGAVFDSVRETLSDHGVAPERVFLVQAAVMDDPATAEDESAWGEGGSDPAQVARVAEAGGVWFTGGDQARIARVLFDGEGEARPMLQTLRRRLEAGAVIGGSSAGAAIQSEVMILRGNGLTALYEDPGRPGPDATMEDGRLILGAGAGFFPHGVIDQHFDRQARLGRLARAVVASDARFGFGIDENTALVVDLAARTAEVVGAGTVTVLDDFEATSPTSGGFSVTGLGLSMATAGDRIDLATGEVDPAPFKTWNVMAEPRARSSAAAGYGPALPATRLDDMLIDDLIESVDTSIARWTFEGTGRAIRFGFEEAATTRALRGRDAEGRLRYSVSGLRFSITPGRVTFWPDMQ